MITISKSELCTMREEERMKTLNVYVFVVDIVIIDVICHLFECCYLLLLLLLFSMFVVVIVMLRFFELYTMREVERMKTLNGYYNCCCFYCCCC